MKFIYLLDQKTTNVTAVTKVPICTWAGRKGRALTIAHNRPLLSQWNEEFQRRVQLHYEGSAVTPKVEIVRYRRATVVGCPYWRPQRVTSCRRTAATISPRPSPPSVGAEAPSVAEHTAVVSHAQHVPTLTAAAAWRVRAAE